MNNQIPTWANLSHHDKYKLLHKNRKDWCEGLNRKENDTTETFMVDGSLIQDIPSFYLALGESINGPRGYFGTCLMSLDDCLSGGFGAKLPVTVIIYNSEELEYKLSFTSYVKYELERRLSILEEEPNATLEDLNEWCVFDSIDVEEKKETYLEDIKYVFNERDNQLILQEGKC